MSLSKEQWKDLIVHAVEKAKHGDEACLYRLAAALEEGDRSKQLLRDYGYGWAGLGLLETVLQIDSDRPSR